MDLFQPQHGGIGVRRERGCSHLVRNLTLTYIQQAVVTPQWQWNADKLTMLWEGGRFLHMFCDYTRSLLDLGSNVLPCIRPQPQHCGFGLRHGAHQIQLSIAEQHWDIKGGK